MADEHTLLLVRFNPSLIMENTTLQPRDGLQAERTTLTFARFAGTLAFTLVAMVLNYRFSSPGEDGGEPKLGQSRYAVPVGVVLIVLALVALAVLAMLYITTIRHYAKGKIRTSSSWPTTVVVGAVVCVLLGVNVALLVEGYS